MYAPTASGHGATKRQPKVFSTTKSFLVVKVRPRFPCVSRVVSNCSVLSHSFPTVWHQFPPFPIVFAIFPSVSHAKPRKMTVRRVALGRTWSHLMKIVIFWACVLPNRINRVPRVPSLIFLRYNCFQHKKSPWRSSISPLLRMHNRTLHFVV